MFNRFPYTSITEINLDWIMRKLKEQISGLVSSVNEMQGDVELTAANIPVSENVTIADKLSAIDGSIESIVDDVGDLDDDITTLSDSVDDRFSTLSDDVDAVKDSISDINDSISDINNTLSDLPPAVSERNLIVMGDSYSLNTALWTGWIDQFRTITTFTIVGSSAVGGSGFIGAPNVPTVQQQLAAMTVDHPDEVTDICILGGYNDASAIEYYSATEADFSSAVSSLMTYIKGRFKNARVHYGFIGIDEHDNGFQSRLNSTASLLKRICSTYGMSYIPNAQYILLKHDYVLQGTDANAKSHPTSSGTLEVARCLQLYLTSGYFDVKYGCNYQGVNFYVKNGQLTAFPDTYSFSSLLPAMTYPFNTWTTIADVSIVPDGIMWGTADALTCFRFWAAIYTDNGTFDGYVLFRFYKGLLQINPLNNATDLVLTNTSWVCITGFTAPFESMYG